MYNGWEVYLDNGALLSEGKDFEVIPGGRKPWVRLVDFLYEHNLYVAVLHYYIKGQHVMMPAWANYYGIQYQAEVELALDGSLASATHFVDLIAGFEDRQVRCSINVSNGKTSREVTNGIEVLAPTPKYTPTTP